MKGKVDRKYAPVMVAVGGRAGPRQTRNGG